MRAIFVLFNSLNRRALGCYGGTTVKTPNFDRLAARSVRFDHHVVGSMPCMPARRDLHTGRLNFLHRSWGPLEPFDNSFPALLRRHGIHSHLISDHYHYFEDGGATYHGRYSTWDFIRGQEADKWKAMVRPPLERLRETYHPIQVETDPEGFRYQNLVNREFIRDESEFPVVQCFARALEFLEINRTADNWLLQVETFDPHEPFTAPARFREAYPTNYGGPILDWPRYREAQREPRRDRRAPCQLRGPGGTLRRAARSAARLHGRARSVAGHGPRSVHRPRLHAVRARLVGQEQDALL